MKYKLVIFDFDGTVANSFPWFLQIVNRVADKYKFNKLTESDLALLRNSSAREMIKRSGVPFWKLPLIARYARTLMNEGIEQVPLFAGVDELLHTLAARGIILALVTSNSAENVRCVLGPANAVLITYYECGVSLFGKSARFRKILRQSGVLPSEAIGIGDEIRDAEAAQKAKIAFGAVAWGYTNVAALQAQTPHEVFTHIEEIVDKIA